MSKQVIVSEVNLRAINHVKPVYYKFSYVK